MQQTAKPHKVLTFLWNKTNNSTHFNQDTGRNCKCDNLKAEALKRGGSPHLSSYFLFEVLLVCIHLPFGFYPLNRIVIEQYGFVRKRLTHEHTFKNNNNIKQSHSHYYFKNHEFSPDMLCALVQTTIMNILHIFILQYFR